MANHIDGIDHVLIAVADLAAAVTTWRRLGFTTTPRGGHPQWGTANHCIMFPKGYLELIGVVRAGASPVADRLTATLAERGEGVAGLALASRDGAAASAALRAAGIAAGEAEPLSRLLEAEDGTLTPEFAIARLPENSLPGLTSFVCQHLTPELLRRPAWVEHRNGAVGLSSMTIAVEDPEVLRPGLERLFGPASTTATDATVAVHTGAGLILLCRPDDLDQLHPDADPEDVPHLPAVVALTVTVADTNHVAALLKANGVPFGRDSGGGIRVDKADANGVFVEFERAY